MSLTLLPLAAILGLGGPELMIILVILLLLFGGAKLPKLARSLGEAQNEFKKGMTSEDKTDGEAQPPAS